MTASVDETCGTGIAVRQVAGAPIVAIRICLPGGVRLEPLAGTAALTGRLLVEGSERRDWREIAEAADGRGMMVSGFTTLELHGLAIDALAADWELALEWAAELVRESLFPADRCDWLRRQALAELKSLADQPEIKTAWSFLRQLYHPHPAGRPLLGEAATLEELDAGTCREFHRSGLGRGLFVTVAGTVEEGPVSARIEELFGDLVRPVSVQPVPPPPDRGAERQTVAISANGAEEQAHLYLGHLTLQRADEDYRALELLGVILGAGPGLAGRIPARIREQEGLAYSAQAHTVAGAGLDRGRFVVYLATAPDRLERAERGVREELVRVLEQGLSDSEVEEARAYLLGREPFLRETARQWAEQLVESLLYGLPLDPRAATARELTALDRPRVESAARRHLDPRRLRVTVGRPVGPP